MTSSKLGEVTYTSQAAVIRFYKKLGIDNFRIFYALYLEEMTERKNLIEIDSKKPIKNNMNAEDIIRTMATYYINEINNTKLSLNKNVIQRIYNRLNSSNYVEIYGNGTASIIVKELSNKISAFGIHCQSIETMKEFRLRYSNSKEKFAIIIALDDDCNMLELMAKEIRKEGTYILGIFNNDRDLLKNICNEYIIINEGANEQNLSTLCSYLYLVDIIYSMLLSHNNK